MNPNQIEFLRQKSTGIKFANVPGRGLVRVAELHLHADWRHIRVKCERCDSWDRAEAMKPVETGVLCAACAAPSHQPGQRAEGRAAAMEKAAKLLRLAKSDNPNEAAIAAARAQEIIDRYNLDSALLSEDGGEPEPEEEIQHFAHDPLSCDKVRHTWKANLAHVVAQCNQCEAYSHGGELRLIGRPSAVAVVRAFFEYLVNEIDRLADKHCLGCSRTYYNNFRLGAVETVSRRLRQSQAATVEAVKAEALANGGAGALVVVEQSIAVVNRRAQEVKEWTARNMKLRTIRARADYDARARDAGRRAGESISLNRPSGALPSGTRELNY